MRPTLFLFIVIILCLSCEKEYLIPKSEVPGWLKERISKDEQIIKSQPHLMQNYGAWYRYKFERDYFYEYDNPLSSSYGIIYSKDGASINTSIAPYIDYEDKKCCETLIWKAPNYKRFKL